MTQHRDLGLTYEAAAHGIQSAIAYGMEQDGIHIVGPATSMMKHMRVGVDLARAEFGALSAILIKKGVITGAEYAEMMRLAANEELARYTEYLAKQYELPDTVSFR